MSGPSPKERADKVLAALDTDEWDQDELEAAAKLIPKGTLAVIPEDLADGWVVLNPEQAKQVESMVGLGPPHNDSDHSVWVEECKEVRDWLAGGSARDNTRQEGEA